MIIEFDENVDGPSSTPQQIRLHEKPRRLKSLRERRDQQGGVISCIAIVLSEKILLEQFTV